MTVQRINQLKITWWIGGKTRGNPGRGNCLKNTGLSGHMQMRLRHRIQGTDCTQWVEIFFVEANLFLFVFMRQLCNGYESKGYFNKLNFALQNNDFFHLSYMHHYNHWLVYLLTHFWRPFFCFQGVFPENSVLMYE